MPQASDPKLSPIQTLLAAQQKREFDPIANLRAALSKANGNVSRNTYITLDPAWSVGEAERQVERFSGSLEDRPLRGLPVSLKDCFDLQGFKTSSGSKFYATRNQPASEDSAIAARLRDAGAFITGKTHLPQLAYSITGKSSDYGDCLQPADASRLTGGSSSGAAASIQEGSALAAIGTDTGGSVRVPAALCGLAGYRSSHGVADWKGGAHLAPSFDTIGWLFRDLRDAPLLAGSVFTLPPVLGRPLDPPGALGGVVGDGVTIGVLTGPLVEDCDAAVKRSLAMWRERLLHAGARLEEFYPEFWSESIDIFAPLQASEAARLHTGFFSEFEPAVAERLKWGAGLREENLESLRQRQGIFCSRMDQLFGRFDLLLMPATPVSRLDADKDQSGARANILPFTTPASLAGLPAIVLPSPDCGLQLLAAHNDDRRLLRFAAQLGEL